MKLLGPYKTQLNAFFYQELLDLLKDAIKAGELSGNRTFDTATVQSLIQQADDFSNLPTPSAGQRVTDDSLNTPINLLQARLKALSAEISDFGGKADLLISVVEKDSILLDQLLSAAYLETWVDTKQHTLGAEKFYWDYGMGYGQSTDEITATDPTTGVTYQSKSPLKTYFDTATGLINSGLSTQQATSIVVVKNLEWQYSTTGQVEELYGNDWAQLSLLEKAPLLTYTDSPTVNVILPTDLRDSDVSGIFSVSGKSTIGSIPIYVKTNFQPRRNSSSVTVATSVDGTFETAAGWTMNGWTRFNFSSDAHSGNYSAKSTNTTALISPSFNIKATQKFYVEAYVNGIGVNGTLQISIQYYDSGANLVSTSNFPVITPITAYEKVSQLLEAPIASATAKVVFTPIGTTVGDWFVDDVIVNLPQTISQYNISQEDVAGYLLDSNDNVTTIYFAGVNFVINGQEITFTNIPNGQVLNMRFTEFYPAYQCSINEKVWSQIIMMDVNRPYLDNATTYDPIAIQGDSFPITDETGSPTGLVFKLLRKPSSDYVLQVITRAMDNYGANANLYVQLERAAYVTGLTLAPFSTFPAKLISIEAEDFSVDTRQLLWTGDGVSLYKELTITFPRRLVRRFLLKFYQENYSFKEHVTEGDDKLRRDILSSLQSVLPLAARRTEPAPPIYYRGSQYEFGFESISAEDSTVSLTVA